jgi:methyltransferase (TIGR00027 family)
VTYIAMDFTQDRLAERLAQAGYDAALPSFFLWEGVVMYLPREAVETTLAVIAGAAPGSTLAFDYVYRASLERPQAFYGAAGYQQYVARRGEPCRFGLDADELPSFLARHRLSLTGNCGVRELARLVPPGPLCDFFGIACAVRD